MKYILIFCKQVKNNEGHNQYIISQKKLYSVEIRKIFSDISSLRCRRVAPVTAKL